MLAIIGMIGFMDYAVMIVIVIAGITLIQRIILTSKKLSN